MKTKAIIMMMSIMLGFGVMTRSYAQDTHTNVEKNLSRKAKRELRKKERMAADQFMFQNAKAALKDGNWVLEANRLITKWGNTIPVDSNTNFVELQNGTAYMQLAFAGHNGPNGMGGITLKGKPTQIKMSTDKNGNVYYQMSVIGNALTADIIVRLGNGDNYASAEVNAITSGARLQFAGQLVPASDSSVYRSGMDF
ncbi:DUF4251 domain-containing protein [Prolixibacter sp. NT017]|uniref:DUF4251 domain-containing protein n=1 Tax=Prolixibacter sp. NT017 TaxID=2652390 RepID=UPI00127326A3|nr:DUF4251 domain-containing protein [Prolixibacter sp. NT017]GET24306.1 hypothetical protein NT017_06350 [Prolixibacter sp. NT017]